MTSHPLSLLRTENGRPRLRIAVVGTGISGLSAAWLLSGRHDVTAFESEAWIGGHSNTIEVEGPAGPIAVDTGFIVYNERNYPNLTALLAHLGVATKPSDMSFSASLDGGSFEYASAGIGRLLGQRRNIARPRFWRMVAGILAFYRDARALAASNDIPDETLGGFLSRRGYPPSLADDHVLPMCAAIWSTTAGEIRELPLRSFLRFFSNHGLFELGARPHWRTIDGGSRAYVAKMAAALDGRIHVRRAARRIARGPLGATVEDVAGRRERYDAVVIATHADQAFGLLSDPSPDERHILGAFRYSDNLAVLHSDPALMPKRKRVWSSWNYIGSHDSRAARLTVTYWMNNLQSLDRRRPLFVTLNPSREPAAGSVKASFGYSHPMFDAAALDAQKRLWSLQGQRRTWYAGAYFGHGFHEDGLQAGLAAAEALGGVRRPWRVENESGRVVLGVPFLEAAE